MNSNTSTLSAPGFVQTRSSISSGVLGMIFLLTTETMLFAAFISAYIVNRASIPQWQPANQPRLPIEITGLNTVILLVSGLALWMFIKKFRSTQTRSSSSSLLLLSMALGVTFVAIQGSEWVQLISYGLNSTTSLYAAFFYLIIGAHALHVVVGLAILLYLYRIVQGGRSVEDKRSIIATCSMYWAFVVAVWPLLYYLVYLS